MGWLKNLWNRIRGNSQLKLSEGYKPIENKMDKYAVNVKPTPNGQSQEEKQLEEVLKAFDKGDSLQMMMKKSHRLTPSQIKACYSICHSESSLEDIKSVGGLKAVVTRMVKVAEITAKRYGYSEEQIENVMPSSEETLFQMMNERMQEEYKQRFKINHPMRNIALNLLYNSALELSIAGEEDIEDILVDYASKIGGMPIIVGGEKPMLEDIDIRAIINLADNVKKGKLIANELEEVGGAAKVIDEMTVKAKMDAFKKGIPISEDLLAVPKEIISTMHKETNKEIEY